LCCAHRWNTLQRRRGRCYIEAEVNRVAKAMFLTFADDVEISVKLGWYTVAYISLIHTWYRWLFGKWVGGELGGESESANYITTAESFNHLGHESFNRLVSSHAIPCNKIDTAPLCHACQLVYHVRIHFPSSTSRAIKNLDLIHCDLWTSLIASVCPGTILSCYSWRSLSFSSMLFETSWV
jgi:hypothetical protein